MALHDRVYYTFTHHELAVFGSGRANPAPAVVVGEPASGGVDLHVLVVNMDRPILVRRDIPAGAVGEPGTWNAANA